MLGLVWLRQIDKVGVQQIWDTLAMSKLYWSTVFHKDESPHFIFQ